MTVTQQWWYLNLAINSFYSLFPMKDITSCRQIISSHLYVRKKIAHLLAEHLNTGQINYI